LPHWVKASGYVVESPLFFRRKRASRFLSRQFDKILATLPHT
jgi:hypothetical protein